MTQWYTADTHFGDPGTLTFWDRPFGSPAAMDEAMVEAVVARVRPGDDLWVVGDFALASTPDDLARAAAAFARLPGRKHLVRGNHDPDPVLALGWDGVHEVAEVRDGGTRAVLCHYPLVTWPGACDGAIHLFGHVHTNWDGFAGAVNVGVDWWGFAPVRLGALELRALSLPELAAHWQAERLLR